jgi:hypothetical protein
MLANLSDKDSVHKDEKNDLWCDFNRFQAHPAAVLVLSSDAVELLPKFYHSSALLTHLALILKTEFDNLAVLQETSYMSTLGISELNFDNLHGCDRSPAF